jgi:phospholipid/cholesterol/gamma-HCH transport system substrate-binding protein
MAEVALLIHAGRRIYTNEEARIRTQFIVGDSQIEFVKVHIDGPVTELPPGSIIYGATPFDMMNLIGRAETSVLGAIDNVSNASEKLAGLMARIDAVVGTPEELRETQARFSRLLETTEQAAQNINAIIGNQDIQEGTRRIAVDVPATLTQIRAILANADATVQDFRTAIHQASGTMDKVDRNLDNVERFTSRLGARGPEIVDNVAISAHKLQGLFDELASLVEAFNNSEGSVKQLMSDPHVFNDLAQTIENTRMITEQTRSLLNDARPIVRNANVLTDRLARQPQLLGLQGVFERSPPVKGLPNMAQIQPIQSPLQLMRIQQHARESVQIPQSPYRHSTNCGGPCCSPGTHGSPPVHWQHAPIEEELYDEFPVFHTASNTASRHHLSFTPTPPATHVAVAEPPRLSFEPAQPTAQPIPTMVATRPTSATPAPQRISSPQMSQVSQSIPSPRQQPMFAMPSYH